MRQITDDTFDELAVWWWGPDTDERTVTDVIESGSMAAFARYVFENSQSLTDD